jgi:5'-3' exonuclease
MNVIVDGNNVFSIAYYASTKDVNPDYLEMENQEFIADVCKTFTTIIDSYINEVFAGYTLYIAWDSKNGSAWRKEILPEYKENRQPKKINFGLALEICRNMKQYKNVYCDNAEGDDVIFAMCSILEDSTVISTDKDFIQLLNSGLCKALYNPIKKVYVDKMDVDPVLYKCMVGDSSDNLKGIPKIGDVKARKLIQNNLEGLTEEQLQIIEKHKQVIDLSRNPYIMENIQTVRSQLGG